MVITLDDICEQKENLLKKHPEMEEANCKRIIDTDIDIDKLADFMWHCWKQDYPSGLTIISKPSIKWNLGNNQMDEDSSLAVYDSERNLRGVVLGYKREYLMNKKKVPAIVNTGFSVNPDYRGKGVCQLLRTNYLLANIKNEYPIMFGWYDTRHNKPGTAHHLYSEEGGMIHCEVPLMGKTLDFETAKKHEKLAFFERLFIQATNIIFPSTEKDNFGLYEIKQFDYKDSESYLEIMKECSADKSLQRLFDKRSIDWQLGYYGEGLDLISYALMTENNCKGLVFGYRNSISDEDHIFFVDGCFLDPNLKYSEKRNFLSSVEAKVKKEYDCFAMVGVRTVFSENPFKFGYVPFDKQTAEIIIQDENINLPRKEILNSYIEFR